MIMASMDLTDGLRGSVGQSVGLRNMTQSSDWVYPTVVSSSLTEDINYLFIVFLQWHMFPVVF